MEGQTHSSDECIALPSTSGVILLADDDPVVRQLARLALEHCGFTVLNATNGEAALAISRCFYGSIKLLLTDFEMPKMDGLELIARVSVDRPGIATLLMSGSGVNAPPGQPFLRKPFGPAQLTEAVRGLISGFQC